MPFAAITKQYSYGPIYYAAAFILAIFTPAASLFLNLLLAIFFAIPPELAAGRRARHDVRGDIS